MGRWEGASPPPRPPPPPPTSPCPTPHIPATRPHPPTHTQPHTHTPSAPVVVAARGRRVEAPLGSQLGQEGLRFRLLCMHAQRGVGLRVVWGGGGSVGGGRGCRRGRARAPQTAHTGCRLHSTRLPAPTNTHANTLAWAGGARVRPRCSTTSGLTPGCATATRSTTSLCRRGGWVGWRGVGGLGGWIAYVGGWVRRGCRTALLCSTRARSLPPPPSPPCHPPTHTHPRTPPDLRKAKAACGVVLAKESDVGGVHHHAKRAVRLQPGHELAVVHQGWGRGWGLKGEACAATA